MRRKPGQLLKIGDVLNGTVVKSNGGRRFLIRCTDAPPGWKVELHARRPETIRPGEPVTVWVVKISPLHGEVLVHEGEHGRLPISEAMGPRYLAALQALLGEVEATGENLADAATMVKLIGKMQSADWFTVWKLLGEPSAGEVKAMLGSIDKVRAARKEAPESMSELQAELDADFGASLRRAVFKLKTAFA